MKVAISFRSTIYMEGENIKDILDKFEEMPLFSADALDHWAEFGQYVQIKDANTGESIWSKIIN